MSFGDTLFVIMALVQFIALAAMAWVGLRMMETARRGERMARPAVEEARSIAETGRSLGLRLQHDGLASYQRISQVAERVRQRVTTTKRLASELRPAARETAEALREVRAEAVETASAAGGLARRLRRLGAATQAAMQANDAPRDDR